MCIPILCARYVELSCYRKTGVQAPDRLLIFCAYDCCAKFSLWSQWSNSFTCATRFLKNSSRHVKIHGPKEIVVCSLVLYKALRCSIDATVSWPHAGQIIQGNEWKGSCLRLDEESLTYSDTLLFWILGRSSNSIMYDIPLRSSALIPTTSETVERNQTITEQDQDLRWHARESWSKGKISQET